MKTIVREGIPPWVPKPSRALFPRASVLLFSMPDYEAWTVAMRSEVQAVDDPQSFLGKLLTPYAALMSLPYLTNN